MKNIYGKLFRSLIISFMLFQSYIIYKNYDKSTYQIVDAKEISYLELKDFSKVIEQVKPGVVFISTIPLETKKEDNVLDQVKKMQGIGSGFIFDKRGYILTNAHVVSDLNEVYLLIEEKYMVTGKVLGRDKLGDLAVIKIDVDFELTPLKFGSLSNHKPGNIVFAMGAPRGLINTVSTGALSFINRSGINLPFGSIQSDVPINPGNSGGPLLNLNGEVIGINNIIVSNSGGSVGLSFSIPVDYVLTKLEKLMKGQDTEYSRIGIAIAPHYKKYEKYSYVETLEIDGISPDGPAAGSGLQKEDVIISVDGYKFNAPEMLTRYVLNSPPNKKIEIKVRRNEEILEYFVITEKRN